MPRLAQTGASLQARARENGTSSLMRCSSSPKFLSLGLLFPKTSCLDKGMRKGEKQSFKKTLNYFSGQLSKSASHSRVKKCFCLILQHTLSLTEQLPIQVTENSRQKTSSSKVRFCSVCNNSNTLEFQYWSFPFWFVWHYSYFQNTDLMI